jgi:hypothetical protein
MLDIATEIDIVESKDLPAEGEGSHCQISIAGLQPVDRQKILINGDSAI